MNRFSEKIKQLGGRFHSDETGAVIGITLGHAQVTDFSLNLLMDNNDAKYVSYLSLAGTSVSDAGLAFLKCLPNLEELSMNETGITGIGFDKQNCTCLKKLSLRDCRSISEAGLSKLANVTTIESLTLSGANINDSSLVQIARLSNLRELRLDRTSVSDVGLNELLGISELRRLSVRNTNVSSKGIELLEQALPNLSLGLIM